MKKKFKLILMILLIVFLIGCEKGNEISEEVSIIISKDFGEIIDTETLELKSEKTVMECIQEKFNVETAYNGGFVNSINDIESGYTNKESRVKKDWFYYVNGYSAVIGADEYFIDNKSQIIWDYHSWDKGNYSQCIIGAYPLNFTKGYGGNKLLINIYSDKKFKNESESLNKQIEINELKDIKELSKDTLENGENHTIIISSLENIKDSSLIKDIFKDYERRGIYANIVNNKIQTFNSEYKKAREYEEACLIVPALKSYGELGTIWIIIGNDDKSIKNALNILSNDSDKIQGLFSAVVVKDKLVSLPEKN